MFLILVFSSFLGASARAGTGGGGQDDKLVAIGPSWGFNLVGRSSVILSSNPPLPMLYQGKGNWKVTVKPYVFQTKIDPEGTAKKWMGEQAAGDYDGKALSVGASYGLGDRWGAFAWGLHASGTGDVNETRSNDDGSYNLTQLSGVDNSFQMVSVGLTKRYFGRKERGFVLSAMYGLTMTHLQGDQRIRLRNKTTNVVYYDADMSLDAWHPGFLLGLQAGVPLGSSFNLNPYAIFIASGIDDGLVFRDKKYKLSAPRVNTAPADPIVTGLNDHDALEVIAGFATIGANLEYQPWGLSANVTAPLLAPLFAKSDGIKLTQFSVSWSFGDYRK